MADKYIEIGQRLRLLREKQGISQSKMAAFLNVSRKLLESWELGSKRINIETLMHICELLDCSADYLLFSKGG